jgi:glycosyltransferase involved in cell wall biosynthesis
MRIVIDLQGAQAENRVRGIGRYSLSLAKAMVRNRGQHQIIIALNGAFTDSIMPIRAAFKGLLPQDQIKLWYAPGPVSQLNEQNSPQRRAAQLIREAFLASLKPDIVLITSLFEGLVDDAVTSIAQLSPTITTAAILYDLIPLIYKKPYLDNPQVAKWYEDKLDHLRRADLLLSISASSRLEGLDHLGLEAEQIVNISTAADPQFKPIEADKTHHCELLQRYGLTGKYVMYTGGIDHRKNIEGLIRAYARLATNVRSQHQLAVVCSIQDADRTRLATLATTLGLANNELVLTGFVSDDDLVGLYGACQVFVFPSKHEGFGLPPLEAMSMGCAVIGGNTSSLPEVIGRPEAMFDPLDDDAITAKLHQVLVDDTFRQTLQQQGLIQAKKFCWDKTARAAIAALSKRVEPLALARPKVRPRLAYVSPLPPSRSGISDYSAELLPELACYYDIDVVVTKRSTDEDWNSANVGVVTVQSFLQHAADYERVLYHFGNSVFHQHMFALIQKVPGVIVLHDFYLSGIVAHRDVNGFVPDCWAQTLYQGHGYAALKHRFDAQDTADVVLKYPCNSEALQQAQGVIVHSQHARRLASHWYGMEAGKDWIHIPHLRAPVFDQNKQQQRAALGIDKDDFVVCSFGQLGVTKLNHRLLDVWLNSSLAKDKHCKLIFVGENEPNDYGQSLITKINKSGLSDNIKITSWVNTPTFRQYLAAADVGVQLRTLSRGETSGTVLDCMNYGLATIVNANGSMADLADEEVYKLIDDFTDEALTTALQNLKSGSQLRQRLSQQAQQIIRTSHAPNLCATEYSKAIEQFHHHSKTAQSALLNKITDINELPNDPSMWLALASAIDRSLAPSFCQRQLLIDISELVQRDAKTGVQRVVRSVLQQFLNNPPIGLRIEPVYATTDSAGYFYARKFILGFIESPTHLLKDEPVSYRAGDIFVGLDLQPKVVPAQQHFIQKMRRQGVSVQFVIYDLLCVTMPQYFIKGAALGHHRWLEAVAQSDGVICISKAVADDFSHWLSQHMPKQQGLLAINWFHLGADIENSNPTHGLPDNAETVLNQLAKHPSFLSVGTLEPRKGHAQTLAAFELLWQAGCEVNLIIVGKAGWLVETLIEKLSNHPQRNKRLFWFDGISDDYLTKIYHQSCCLIAASFGEGFGLPLIEAAQHQLPIIARDIPVFKEVAGQHAFYFSGLQPQNLSSAIEQWLTLYESHQHPTSQKMHWLKWHESADKLKRLIIAMV